MFSSDVRPTGRDGPACPRALLLTSLRLVPRAARPTHTPCLTPCVAYVSCLALRYASSHLTPPVWTRAAHSRGSWTMGNLHAVASSFASTSLHWAAASRCWCCMCRNIYIRMLQVYVTNILAIFQTYVASGLSEYCICCTGYTRTL
jgi:hypothetical protein